MTWLQKQERESKTWQKENEGSNEKHGKNTEGTLQEDEECTSNAPNYRWWKPSFNQVREDFYLLYHTIFKETFPCPFVCLCVFPYSARAVGNEIEIYGILCVISDQRSRGRKKVKRDRSKLYRNHKKLEAALDCERRAAERYKKKYHRLVKQLSTEKAKSTPSPRTRTKLLLRHWRRSPEKQKVTRTLTFHYSTLADFRAKFFKTRNEKQCSKLLWEVDTKVQT